MKHRHILQPCSKDNPWGRQLYYCGKCKRFLGAEFLEKKKKKLLTGQELDKVL